MDNFIKDIAKISKNDRYNAIINVLNNNGIEYKIQKINNNSIGNIIVEYNKGSDSKIVVSAHYDNVINTPGANDNASACSIVLNLLLFFKSTRKHFEFVFFDLEEAGLVGSNYYLNNNKDNINFAINLDMCGLGENIVVSRYKTLMFDSILNRLMDLNECIEYEALPLGDAYSFINKGIPTLYVINSTNHDLEWYEQYQKNSYPFIIPEFLKTMHKENDTIETINVDQVEKIYQFLLQVLDALN